MGEPVLCYVTHSIAFFTTQPLEKQWGDDWNDAPYEHNAGDPYGWRPEKWVNGQGNVPNDEPSWEIVKVYFDGPWETPSEYERNSRWSVEDINAGLTPWLVTDRYSDRRPRVAIPAGTTLTDFIRLVHLGGGDIYLKAPNQGDADGNQERSQDEDRIAVR